MCIVVFTQISSAHCGQGSQNKFLIVVQAYSNYGDIIRHTMAKCREISNTAFAKALLLSLQQEFEKLLDDNDGIADTNSKDFTAIKVLL